MKVILITKPNFFEGETAIVNRMFDAGLPLLHLRKPDATAEEMEAFLRGIAEGYRGRVVLHSNFRLVGKYALLGAHLSVGRSLDIDGFVGQTSYSCHSFVEVANEKDHHAYVFLSPVFNSISKQGYTSAFTEAELLAAHSQGIIDERVVALGGITPASIDRLHTWGFGGVAILGDVWQNPDPVARLSEYLSTCR